MPRKRKSLTHSIAAITAGLGEFEVPSSSPGDHCDHIVEPDEMVPSVGEYETHPSVDLALGDDNTITAVATISPEGKIKVTAVPPTSPEDLFRDWSRTPEGYRATDTRIPTDPIRLGSILDDNARLAFMAGYAAATPSFE